MEETVLVQIEDKQNRYLMMLRNKKANDINKEKWIGPGGHIEPGETPEDAVIRETKEETGLTLLTYQKRGLIHFICDGYEQYIHLYTSNSYEGELIECNEGELRWIDKYELLNMSIWEGDKIFLKYLTDNEPYFELKLKYINDVLVETTRTL